MMLLRVQQMHDCTIADGPCKPWSANESHWENGSSKKKPNQYRAPLSVKINCRDCTPQELNNRHFLNMIDPQHASWLKYILRWSRWHVQRVIFDFATLNWKA
jgi:hypothetical protein